MKFLSLIVSCLLFFSATIHAQNDPEADSLDFVMSYTLFKEEIKTLSFEGSVDKKKALSNKLDKTRHFKVYAQKNLNNMGYQFDWLISESTSANDNRIFLFKHDDFFEILEGEKKINVLENIGKLNENNEAEILRELLLPNEVIYGLWDVDQKSQVTFEDDGEFYKMYNQLEKNLLRIVCYNKETLFPENTDVIHSYPNMSALDITSVRVDHVEVNEVFLDSILSMKKYLNRGYTVNFMDQLAQVESPSPSPSMESLPEPQGQIAMQTTQSAAQPAASQPVSQSATQSATKRDAQIKAKQNEILQASNASRISQIKKTRKAKVNNAKSLIPDPSSAAQQAPQTQHSPNTPSVALSQGSVNKLLKTDLQTAKGWETTIAPFHDKSYLLLDFWSESSPVSMEDLHTVQSLHRDFRKRGLRVFGVNCKDFNEKKTVVKKLKQKGITFTNFFGKSINLKKWDVKSIPSYLLLDEDNNIVLQGGSEVLVEIRGYLNSGK